MISSIKFVLQQFCATPVWNTMRPCLEHNAPVYSDNLHIRDNCKFMQLESQIKSALWATTRATNIQSWTLMILLLRLPDYKPSLSSRFIGSEPPFLGITILHLCCDRDEPWSPACKASMVTPTLTVPNLTVKEALRLFKTVKGALRCFEIVTSALW